MTGAQLAGERGALESPAGANTGKAPVASRTFGKRWPKLLVRFIGLLYLALMLALPRGPSPTGFNPSFKCSSRPTSSTPSG